jgi:hypothetical protein
MDELVRSACGPHPAGPAMGTSSPPPLDLAKDLDKLQNSNREDSRAYPMSSHDQLHGPGSQMITRSKADRGLMRIFPGGYELV